MSVLSGMSGCPGGVHNALRESWLLREFLVAQVGNVSAHGREFVVAQHMKELGPDRAYWAWRVGERRGSRPGQQQARCSLRSGRQQSRCSGRSAGKPARGGCAPVMGDRLGRGWGPADAGVRRRKPEAIPAGSFNVFRLSRAATIAVLAVDLGGNNRGARRRPGRQQSRCSPSTGAATIEVQSFTWAPHARG